MLDDWPQSSKGVVQCPASVNATALQSLLKWAYNCCLNVPGEAVDACQALCRAANLPQLAEKLGNEAQGQGDCTSMHLDQETVSALLETWCPIGANRLDA